MIEDNVFTYYRGLTNSLDGQFVVQENAIWFTTGRCSLMRFNGLLRTQASSQYLAMVCDPILNTFFSNKLPFFWADYPPGGIPGLGQYLISNGISLLVRDMPAMKRSLSDLTKQHLPSEVELSVVRTPKDQFDWLGVLMEGFQEPEESRIDFQQYLTHSLAEPGTGWRHFLARWDGSPCAISTLLCAQQAAGIYHVTTLPKYRGRGLGKALTLAAMQAAHQIGYSSAVLFATTDGYPLYQKLGFETVLTLDFYGWDGE